MHLGEALLPREDAIRLARETLLGSLDRLARYYEKRPDMRPDPDGALAERIRADDTWIFVPFRRADASADPLIVRVTGVTKTASIERSF